MNDFDAVILCGGTGRRLGGVDKAAITVRDAALLDLVIEATSAARATVCVGPERTTSRPVVWTRESPPGGGPVAALNAGLESAAAPVVVVLAVDLPFVTAEVVSRLVEACATSHVDAALAEDGAGRVQPLLAAYRVAPLRARLRHLGSPAGTAGLSMMRLIEGLGYVTVPEPEAAQDFDTPEDMPRFSAQLAIPPADAHAALGGACSGGARPGS